MPHYPDSESNKLQVDMPHY